MGGSAPTDEAMHGLRAGHQKAFLTELRCFDYCTLHPWASFPWAWLLSCPAIAEEQHREFSQSSEDSPTYPCFGGPTISLCAFVIVWNPGNSTVCAKICCYKILVQAQSTGLQVCRGALESTEHPLTTPT